MTSPHTRRRPQPHPGVLAVDLYVPGKSKAAGFSGVVHKLSSNETPLGPSPAAVVAFGGATDRLAAYPRRQRHAAARGDRRDARARPRPHRVRGRLGRAAEPSRQHLLRARHAGHLHRARLPHLPRGPAGRRRRAGHRRGQGLHRRRRRDPRRRHGAHPHRLRRQPQQPDRHLSVRRRRRAPRRQPAARTCCWCSTRPTPSTPPRRTSEPASPWRQPARTSSSPAPSRRSTDWPACGSAGASRPPRSATR